MLMIMMMKMMMKMIMMIMKIMVTFTTAKRTTTKTVMTKTTTTNTTACRVFCCINGGIQNNLAAPLDPYMTGHSGVYIISSHREVLLAGLGGVLILWLVRDTVIILSCLVL